MYLLGYDIGSSSVKAALFDCRKAATVAVVQSPSTEMTIRAPHPGWAEQDPEEWWQHLCTATQNLLAASSVNPAGIAAIGIAYQMHGLVVVDNMNRPLRPAIIWCDSRAVDTGELAFHQIGQEKCLHHLLNSPGNFTASKLKWVKDNEPAIFEKIHRFLLPGDYIALRLTGETLTTPGGLSEGILWDFLKNEPATFLLDYFGFDQNLLPPLTPPFSRQGSLCRQAAEATGLPASIPLTYRAGDQPNNALALGVLQPGEVAATGGTSGVVYAVLDKPAFDPKSRVNTFLHVNHSPENPRTGILLCINGAGSQYAWMKNHLAANGISYIGMEQMAATVPPGCEGLCLLPFGNGAERMLENCNPGAHLLHLDFYRHNRAHLYRAALEGIAFAFVYGIGILRQMGLNLSTMRAGNDNLFRSAIFSTTIATLAGADIAVINATGAVGAAKAAGVAAGIFHSPDEAVKGSTPILTYHPEKRSETLLQAYENWESALKKAIDQQH